MKYLASALITISLVGVAIFGPALFQMSPNHIGGCVASAVDGTGCPTNLVNFFAHHLVVMQTLTRTVVPSVDSLFFLIASLVLTSFLIFLSSKKFRDPKLEYLPNRIRDLSLYSSYGQRKTISWLSLLKLSPARS